MEQNRWLGGEMESEPRLQFTKARGSTLNSGIPEQGDLHQARITETSELGVHGFTSLFYVVDPFACSSPRRKDPAIVSKSLGKGS